jgi:hypothetical protein
MQRRRAESLKVASALRVGHRWRGDELAAVFSCRVNSGSYQGGMAPAASRIASCRGGSEVRHPVLREINNRAGHGLSVNTRDEPRCAVPGQ